MQNIRTIIRGLGVNNDTVCIFSPLREDVKKTRPYGKKRFFGGRTPTKDKKLSVFLNHFSIVHINRFRMVTGG